jgi:peptidoglycan L-alanyl-D-glutamate endopeptidase CwlK
VTASGKIKAIQRILGVKDDGLFRTKSQAALTALVNEAAGPAEGVRFDERTEKNLMTLHPKAQVAFRRFMADLIPHMAAKGVVAKVISGNRTYAEQDALYAQGRTEPGKIVTNAKGGYSNHNFGVALDIGLFRNGDYLGSSPLYAEAGPIGEAAGLKWGGRWTSFKDEPHFEYPTGLTLAQMRKRVADGGSVL